MKRSLGMLKGRFVRKVMMAGVAICAIGMVAITGCMKPQMEYLGRWDTNGNCVKYGNQCAVFSVQLAEGYSVAEYVVDLR